MSFDPVLNLKSNDFILFPNGRNVIIKSKYLKKIELKNFLFINCSTNLFEYLSFPDMQEKIM